MRRQVWFAVLQASIDESEHFAGALRFEQPDTAAAAHVAAQSRLLVGIVGKHLHRGVPNDGSAPATLAVGTK